MPTILKIPFDKCIVEQQRRGAREAPDIIQKEFEQLSGDFKVKWSSVNELDDFERMHQEIEASARKVYKNKDFLIGLGGDHSVSYSLVKAFFETHKNAGLIVFDAHLDCVHNFYPPTHEDWLRVLIEKKIISKGKVFHFGSRNNTKDEILYAADNFTWDSIEVSLSAVKEDLKEFLDKIGRVYVSLDIDVIDPKFAPGTGWPEPKGVTSEELMDLLKFILKSGKVRAVDVVEVSPPRDIDNITSRLAAKILAECLK